VLASFSVRRKTAQTWMYAQFAWFHESGRNYCTSSQCAVLLVLRTNWKNTGSLCTCPIPCTSDLVKRQSGWMNRRAASSCVCLQFICAELKAPQETMRIVDLSYDHWFLRKNMNLRVYLRACLLDPTIYCLCIYIYNVRRYLCVPLTWWSDSDLASLQAFSPAQVAWSATRLSKTSFSSPWTLF